MADSIYVIAMFCLDENGETRLHKRGKTIREKHGHGECVLDRCAVCFYKQDSRTVGWFATFEVAEEMVLKYAPWDCLYSHAVIEEVPPGIHNFGKVMQWYKLLREEGKFESDCQVEKVERPKSFENIIGLTMG